MAGFLFAWGFYAVEAARQVWVIGMGWPRRALLGRLLLSLGAGMLFAVVGRPVGAGLGARCC